MASAVLDGGASDGRSARIWRWAQSRYVLGGGYAVAALLATVAILLAASPPQQGPS